MKIVFVSNDDDKYGAPKSLMELVCTLKDNHGIYPIVLTSKKNKVNEYCDSMGIENYATHHANVQIPKNRNKIKFVLKYIIRKFQYELGKKHSLKIVNDSINFDEIDVIHSNTTAIDFGAILAQKYNKPHVWHIREFGSEDYSLVPLRRKFIKFMTKNTTKFICISNIIKQSWLSKGIPENKMSVVYNGIKIPEELNVAKDLDGKKIKIVFAGSISETKGQLQLIEALKLLDKEDLKDVVVDFYGDGNRNYIDSLKKIVSSSNLDAVVNFKGYCSNLLEIYPKYDVGIVCSKSEGFGRVTVEYMISGLCVIASSTGANPEIICDNTGLIYEYGNVEDLKDKICLILKNRNIISNYSINAVNRVKKNFTTMINAKNIYEEYKKINKNN